MPPAESSPAAPSIPPPEGWTLLEAAAALLPVAWTEAQFPDDDNAAKDLPGMQPQPSPWTRVPADAVHPVAAAVFGGLPPPPELKALVSECRAHEAETAQRIAAARTRRAERRAALPGMLAARLARGDVVARGVDSRAPLTTVEIPPAAWGAARIALGWEGPSTLPGRRPHSGLRVQPPPAGSVRLPGNVTLLGVRVFAMASARDTKTAGPAEPEVEPHAGEPPQDPDIYRTGVAGRPTSRQLVEREHGRRLSAGEAYGSVAQEARQLAAWLTLHHPEAPAMTAGTIENTIRAAHRRATKYPTQ
jgi:hypothetical protein